MAHGMISAEAIEVLCVTHGGARVSQDVIEVLLARPVPSPTTITGAGVSQQVIEVLMGRSNLRAVVGQEIIEVLMIQEDEPAPPAGGGGTHGWVMIG